MDSAEYHADSALATGNAAATTPVTPTDVTVGKPGSSAPMTKDEKKKLCDVFGEGLESLKRAFPTAKFLRPNHSEHRTYVLSDTGAWPIRRADCVLYTAFMKEAGIMPPRHNSSHLPVSDAEKCLLVQVFAPGLDALQQQFPEANFTRSAKQMTYELCKSGTWPVDVDGGVVQ